MATADEQNRHLISRSFSEAILFKFKTFETTGFRTSSTRVAETLVFQVSGVIYVVYRVKDGPEWLIFATIYHLYAGRFNADGSLEEESPTGLLLGYKVDYPAIWSHIRKMSRAWLWLRRFRRYAHLRGKPSLLWAQSDNLGHHIWNEQSGLDYLLNRGAMQQIGEVLVGPHDFFETAVYFRSSGVRSRMSGPLFSKPRLIAGAAIRITDLHFPKQTRRRLLKRIQESDTSLPVASMLAQMDRCWPVVAIQLRAHGRIWRSERSMVPTLVQWLKAHYPNAAVILDGFSRGRSAVESSARSDDEWEILSELEALWRNRIFSTKCLTVSEKSALILRCHIVIGPIGSNGVLANWLLHRPMVSYGPTSYYSWAQNDSQKVPEESCPYISYIPTSQITDYEDSCYDFPLSQLTALLKERISSLKQSK